MNAITEIIVSIIGILILSFIIYLLIDIYKYQRAKSKDKSVVSAIKGFASDITYETKRGFNLVTGRTTKALSKDVYTDTKKIGKGISSGAKIIGKDIEIGAKKVGQGIENVAEKTGTGAKDVVRASTIALARDTNTAIDKLTQATESTLGMIKPTPQPTKRPLRPTPTPTLGILSSVGKDIETGAKEFVNDVVRGTERVYDSTTGEIPNDMNLFASGIEKINQKIENGLKDLKQDIFHIHGRLDKAENRHRRRSTKNKAKVSHHTPSPTRLPTPSPTHTAGQKGQHKPRRSSEHPHRQTHKQTHREKKSDLKEVFNVSQNIFTYDEAPLVCKSLGAELATYDQMLDAYKTGANWCNYGWTQNQMAMYPTQEKFYDELQKGPESHRNDCGKPGLNGGYFSDKNMKFGVNCYGHRPEPDPSRIVYLDEDHEKERIKHPDEFYHVEGLNHKLDKVKRKLKKEKVSPLPFSPHQWSRDSEHTSKYMVEQHYANADVPSDLIPSTNDKDVPEGPKCAKTRFGCCKDGSTPRADCSGTNCPENKRRCLPRCPQHKLPIKKVANHNYVVAEETVL